MFFSNVLAVDNSRVNKTLVSGAKIIDLNISNAYTSDPKFKIYSVDNDKFTLRTSTSRDELNGWLDFRFMIAKDEKDAAKFTLKGKKLISPKANVELGYSKMNGLVCYNERNIPNAVPLEVNFGYEKIDKIDVVVNFYTQTGKPPDQERTGFLTVYQGWFAGEFVKVGDDFNNVATTKAVRFSFRSVPARNAFVIQDVHPGNRYEGYYAYATNVPNPGNKWPKDCGIAFYASAPYAGVCDPKVAKLENCTLWQFTAKGNLKCLDSAGRPADSVDQFLSLNSDNYFYAKSNMSGFDLAPLNLEFIAYSDIKNRSLTRKHAQRLEDFWIMHLDVQESEEHKRKLFRSLHQNYGNKLNEEEEDS